MRRCGELGVAQPLPRYSLHRRYGSGNHSRQSIVWRSKTSTGNPFPLDNTAGWVSIRTICWG